jgi:hypothetical protein
MVKKEANVVSLHGGPTGIAEVNEACVQTLEIWLDMAKSGEIAGVALAGLGFDGCGRYAIGGLVGGYSILGALEMVRSDLVDLVR